MYFTSLCVGDEHMLLQLEIKDFAIIEHTLLDFEEGFGALTGETGSGKSILLDALTCILGDRASKSLIRKGSTKAYLKAVFLKTQTLSHKLNELNIVCNDDFLIVERELFASGKSFAKINGSLSTTQTIRDVCEDLIEICGQRDQQMLLKDSSYLFMLDEVCPEPFAEKRKQYVTLFSEFKEIEKKIEELQNDYRERERMLDLYSFHIKEIDKAALSVGEDSALEQERKFLSSFEKIFKNISSANQSLTSIDDLYQALNALQNAAKYDENITPFFERLEKAYFEIQDISSDLISYENNLSYDDEERLNEVNERLHLITSLKRKYADDIESILVYREEIFEKLDQIQNRDAHLETLSFRQKELEGQMNELCTYFDLMRRESAQRQECIISKELSELCMDGARVVFDIEYTNTFTSFGKNKVSLLFCANKGEDLKPISKIASGGELSRVLLAFKIAMQSKSGVSTLFFDEVDQGIGGEVGRHIGLKLRELATNVQVICISHLPQVASKASYHFVISKTTKGDRTVSSVNKLSSEERKFEIARMIYGDAIDSVTLEQAQVMLS